MKNQREAGHRRTLRRVAAGAMAGVAAAGAYAMEQAVDLRALNYPTDDRLLLGRVVTRDNEDAKRIGLAMHLMNGAAVGIVYALIAEPRLPGSPLARGLTFTMGETLALFPLMSLGRFHPAIKDGSLASYWTRTGFVQQVLRHVAFGVMLGPTTELLLRKR